jgi:hypothetical protein
VFQIEVKLKGIEGLSKSQVNRALKKANELTGVHFRHKLLPERFTEQGGRRLNYTPRRGEFRVGAVKLDKASRKLYAVRKFKKLGHSDPLVFSGEGKRVALQNPNNVRATRDKFIIPLPRKYNRSNPKSRIKMSDEIRRVTNRELSALTKLLVAHTESQLNLIAGVSRFKRVESATITEA